MRGCARALNADTSAVEVQAGGAGLAAYCRPRSGKVCVYPSLAREDGQHHNNQGDL